MSDRDVVLVGVDGSEASDHALEWAADEARRRGWSLHLVCAYTVPVTAGIAGEITSPLVDDDSVSRVASETCAAAARAVASRRDAPPVRTSIAYGDAAGVLVDASASAGLVVVGKRGKGGFTSRLLGGVSTALPAHAACPTVVVPLPRAHHGEHERDEDERSEPAEHARVVVGTDGSLSAAHAVDVAASFARERGWPVVLLAAVPLAVPTLAWLPTALDPEPVVREVRGQLDAAAHRLRTEHPGLEVSIDVVHDSPARALTDASRTAGLVVVGARGHGGFAGMLLGSVSQTVLRHAQCPVLVVPHEDDDRREARLRDPVDRGGLES